MRYHWSNLNTNMISDLHSYQFSQSENFSYHYLHLVRFTKDEMSVNLHNKFAELYKRDIYRSQKMCRYKIFRILIPYF